MPKTQSSAVRGFRALFRAGRGVVGSPWGMSGGAAVGNASQTQGLPGFSQFLPDLSRAVPRQLSRVEPLEPRQFLSVSIQNGWTVVHPEGGARVVYVSSSRGSDSNPGSESRPVRSIRRAKSMIASGRGDQVLLRRGDVWREPIGHWKASGRSSSQPAVLGAYGSGERPRIEARNALYMYSRPGAVHDVVFQSIHLRSPGGQDGVRVLGAVDNLLFEDLKVERYNNNFVFDRNGGAITDVRVRRSVICDALPIGSGHSQGLFADGTDRLTVEENTFDGNGRAGGASALSHNCYITSSNTGFVARGNVFSNAAGHGLQARAGGIVENNYFYNNSTGMSFGLVNGDGLTRAGGVSGRVVGNVFQNPDSAGSRRMRIGIEVSNIKRGGSLIANNVFVNGHPSRVADAAITLSVGRSRKNGGQAVGINDLTISGNTVRNWRKPLGVNPKLRPGGSGPYAYNHVVISGNSFSGSGGGRSIRTPSVIRCPAAGTVLAARNQSRNAWNTGLTGGAFVSWATGGKGTGGVVVRPPTNVVPEPPPPPSTGNSGSGSGPAVTIGDTSGLEPDAGTSNFRFTIRLASRSSRAVYVRWETKGRTALVGRDYIGLHSTAVFRPGETSKTITVRVKGERIREANEQFVVNLLGATNARITDSQGVATIRNED